MSSSGWTFRFRKSHDGYVLSALISIGDARYLIDLLVAHDVGFPEIVGADTTPSLLSCAPRSAGDTGAMLVHVFTRLSYELCFDRSLVVHL